MLSDDCEVSVRCSREFGLAWTGTGSFFEVAAAIE